MMAGLILRNVLGCYVASEPLWRGDGYTTIDERTALGAD